jgi:hypothetical protein
VYNLTIDAGLGSSGWARILYEQRRPALTKPTLFLIPSMSMRLASKLIPVCALSVASCFLASAWPQTARSCPGVDNHPLQQGFLENFGNTNYEIDLHPYAGYNSDLNAAYFDLYYSITNANAFANSGCPMEIVMVANFPDARYFSLTNNDMHWGVAQHITDADIVPVGGAPNPYTKGQPFTGSAQYLIPVGLGYIPDPAGSGYNPACGISPETQNLVDATQRHLSMDWNANITGDAPAVAHVIDTPDHMPHAYNYGSTTVDAGPNTAGNLMLRSYLEPAWACSGSVGNVTCTPPPCAATNGDCYSGASFASEFTTIPTQYFIVRDANTGCAYKRSYVEQNLLHEVSVPTSPSAATAIVSRGDPSTPTTTNWLDLLQISEHGTNAKLTPELCYADGDPKVAAHFGNKVAWNRAPEYIPMAGPDIEYLAGSISGPDVLGLYTGANTACPQTGNGCLIRMQFRLPNMPDTPCSADASGGYNCRLSGREDLRYMSLTLADYPGNCTQGAQSCWTMFASMADPAFKVNVDPATHNKYVTLLVNIAVQKKLPVWLQQTATNGRTFGIQPIQPPAASGTGTQKTFSAWTVGGKNGNYYTVLDLTQLPAFTGPGTGVCTTISGKMTCWPLRMYVRNTVPDKAFRCAVNAVPFSMAEYTDADGNGAGLMGPYAPLVDFVDPNTLSQDGPGIPSLPSASFCGVLPTGSALSNTPSLRHETSVGVQFWPPKQGTHNPADPPYLVCGTVASSAPQIDFVATPFANPASAYFSSGTCSVPDSSCSQIIAQAPQFTELGAGSPWQPTLPLTIAGTGFGYLPNQNLPAAVVGSRYLKVQNDNASHLGAGPWDTSTNHNCQLYIENWTDTSISVAVSLANPAAYPPFSDYTYQTFASAPACPVNPGDGLSFTVKNPQSSGHPSTTKPITVGASTTQPF